jgi:hypothetical protein
LNTPEPDKFPRQQPTHDEPAEDGAPSSVHEIRNLLAVAIATVQGIIDGKFEPGARMETLLKTLKRLADAVDRGPE